MNSNTKIEAMDKKFLSLFQEMNDVSLFIGSFFGFLERNTGI